MKDIFIQRYREHKKNAHARRILFLLSFEEWRKLWIDSGKWKQRGPNRGQYCMARYNDAGPYKLGNVRICLIEDNRAERNVNYPLAGEHNPAYGKDYWASSSTEAVELRKKMISAKTLGIPKSAQMRSALKEYWNTMSDELKMRRIRKITTTITGRRIVLRDGQRRWSYPNDSDYPTGV